MLTRPSPEVRPAVALQVLFILFGITIAAFFPFLALFLSARGLSPSQIGIVIAAMAVARIIANPIWGHVADTTLGRRTTLQIGALGAAAAAIGLFVADGYLPIVLLGFVFAAFSTTAGPNIDAITLEHLGDERMGDYGRIRGWESLSYAVACLLIGLTLEAADPTWTMPIYAVGIFCVAAWTVMLRADRPGHRERHGRLGAVGAVFREAPAFWQFLLALLLVWIGFNAAWNFIALKIAARGRPAPRRRRNGARRPRRGPRDAVVLSVRTRVGPSPGVRLGCCIYALGFLLWGLIENPTIVSLLTVFEGMAFALLFTTTVVVIGRMLPSTLYSTGQSMASLPGSGSRPSSGRASEVSCSSGSASSRSTSARRASRSPVRPPPGWRCPHRRCPAPRRWTPSGAWIRGRTSVPCRTSDGA